MAEFSPHVAHHRNARGKSVNSRPLYRPVATPQESPIAQYQDLGLTALLNGIHDPQTNILIIVNHKTAEEGPLSNNSAQIIDDVVVSDRPTQDAGLGPVMIDDENTSASYQILAEIMHSLAEKHGIQAIMAAAAQEAARRSELSGTVKKPMSPEDLAAFKACSDAHQWAETDSRPTDFIRKHFSPWFGLGLTRPILAEAQPLLMEKYGQEITKNPHRRIKEIQKSHRLPITSPPPLRLPHQPISRPPSLRLVAELTPAEHEKRKAKNNERKTRSRQKNTSELSNMRM